MPIFLDLTQVSQHSWFQSERNLDFQIDPQSHLTIPYFGPSLPCGGSAYLSEILSMHLGKVDHALEGQGARGGHREVLHGIHQVLHRHDNMANLIYDI